MAAFLHLRKMTTLWFKVENGPATRVKIKEALIIDDLKQEIISQHLNAFVGQDNSLSWNLFRSDTASEPEKSWDSLAVLANGGETGPTALVMRRVQTQGMTTSEY